MLTTDGKVEPFKRLLRAIRPPKVVLVLEQAARMMAALGAAADAYSTSIVASPSSVVVPGAVQLFVPVAGAGDSWVSVAKGYRRAKPNSLRNVVQSPSEYRYVSSIRTIDWPFPEYPAVNSGVRL